MKYGLAVVVRRTAQLVAAGIGGLRTLLLMPFLAIGLALNPTIFDRAYYRKGEPSTGFRRRFPKLEFILNGAWRMRDPHPGFCQQQVARQFPNLLLHPPILNFALVPGARLEAPAALPAPMLMPAVAPAALAPPTAPPPVPAPTPLLTAAQPPPPPVAALPQQPPPPVLTPADTPASRFEQLWPLIYSDAVDLSQEVSSITPTAHVRKHVSLKILDNPARTKESEVAVELLRRLPERVDHLFLVPWLGIRGGAERVFERLVDLVRAAYPHERIAILLPDASHSFTEDSRSAEGIATAAINDLLPNASAAARQTILDRVLVNLRPANVHNASSLVGWMLFLKNGDRYMRDMNVYVSIYSDIRINDGDPVGYYHNYLPYMIHKVTGVLCDNRRVIERAIRDFGLTGEMAGKFFHIPTPVVGLNGGRPERDMRPYTVGRPRRSLWMSRIAIEKRIDVLNAIMRAVPDRMVGLYGAMLKASKKIDMTLLDLPNIDYRGEFSQLDDLPVEEFDSYVFTSDYEGMPMAVLEATRLGLPVVAPDVGGIGELIDEETGWLVSSSTAIDEYVAALREIEQNAEEAARRVAAAQRRLAERHSLGSFIRSLEQVPGYLPGEAS